MLSATAPFYGIKKFALIIRPHLCLVGIRLHLWMLIFFHLQITVGIAEYIKAAINKQSAAPIICTTFGC